MAIKTPPQSDGGWLVLFAVVLPQDGVAVAMYGADGEPGLVVVVQMHGPLEEARREEGGVDLPAHHRPACRPGKRLAAMVAFATLQPDVRFADRPALTRVEPGVIDRELHVRQPGFRRAGTNGRLCTNTPMPEVPRHAPPSCTASGRAWCPPSSRWHRSNTRSSRNRCQGGAF